MDPGSKADGYPAESSYQVKVVWFPGGFGWEGFWDLCFFEKKATPEMVRFVKKGVHI